mmetsp:Transcript_44655/g.129975  ORF Transcript_44655/g.129975 Transcript_44655/m.129975 type:complete len:223 (-) Transcript_44655:131-799(-)
MWLQYPVVLSSRMKQSTKGKPVHPSFQAPNNFSSLDHCQAGRTRAGPSIRKMDVPAKMLPKRTKSRQMSSWVIQYVPLVLPRSRSYRFTSSYRSRGDKQPCASHGDIFDMALSRMQLFAGSVVIVAPTYSKPRLSSSQTYSRTRAKAAVSPPCQRNSARGSRCSPGSKAGSYTRPMRSLTHGKSASARTQRTAHSLPLVNLGFSCALGRTQLFSSTRFLKAV